MSSALHNRFMGSVRRQAPDRNPVTTRPWSCSSRVRLGCALVPARRLVVLTDRERDEHREDDPDPDERVSDRVLERPRVAHGDCAGVAERLPHRLGDRRHRVPLRERLERPGEPVGVNERVGDERHREDEHERGVVDHLDRRHLEADIRHDPRDPKGKREQQQIAAGGLDHAGVDAPPDDEAGRRHEHDRRQVVEDVGPGAPDDDRRAGHRQRPEAVDDALGHVLCERRPGERRPEDDRLGEDPGHEELPVGHTGDLDHRAEHVTEQEHEHDRRHRDPHEDLGHPGDLDEVAPPDDDAVLQGECYRAHLTASLSTSSSIALSASASAGAPFPVATSSAWWPVRVKNTSSSVGRRSPTSTTLMLASARWLSTPLNTSTPPDTAAVSLRDWVSTWTSPTQKPDRIVWAGWTSSELAKTVSMRSPPTSSLSSSA